MLRFIPTSLATLVLIGTLGVPQTSHAVVASGKWHPVYHVQTKGKASDPWRSVKTFDRREDAQRFIATQFAVFFAVRIHEDRQFRSTPHANVGPFQQNFQHNPFLFGTHHDSHNQHQQVHHDSHQQQNHPQFNSQSSSSQSQQSNSKSKKK
jgi:hypothetical protein